jgi:hypothetical protein
MAQHALAQTLATASTTTALTTASSAAGGESAGPQRPQAYALVVVADRLQKFPTSVV